MAAGCSSRLGRPKQLVKIGNTSLLQAQAKHALLLTEHVYCVLGYQAEVMAAELKNLPVKIVINEHWSDGLGSSIVTGVRELPKEISAVMLLLVDQWQLSSVDFALYYQCWRKQPQQIYIAGDDTKPFTASDKVAPPVIFPRFCFAQLQQLKGAQGAKKVLVEYEPFVKKIKLPQAFKDLDTPEHLDEFYQQAKRLK